MIVAAYETAADGNNNPSQMTVRDQEETRLVADQFVEEERQEKQSMAIPSILTKIE